MRRAFRLAVAVLTGLTLGSAFLSVVITEGALHIRRRPAASMPPAEALSRQTGASWETVKVVAEDGIVLDG